MTTSTLRRIVITGASGYIGRVLAERLAGEGHALRLVSRTDDRTWIATASRNQVECVAANLQEEEAWLDLIIDADAVVHLSARTDLRAAEADPTEDELLNVQPMRGLLGAVSRLRPAKLAVIFASAVTIVGDRHENPVDERTPDNPVSVYDRHKLVCERLLANATGKGLIQACSLRLSNVYGYGFGPRNANRGILNTMIKRALKAEPVTIWGGGQYVRDFVHVDDVVKAFCCALTSDDVCDGQHYVVASGEGRTLADVFTNVAREAGQVTGCPVHLRYVPEPVDLHIIERRNFVGSPARLRSKTGWVPHIDLESGIRRTCQDMMAIVDVVRPISYLQSTDERKRRH
jgi:nucleoside-diphosphate-sugar epimerase